MIGNLNSENDVLTGAKQTMISWTKVIESYEAVPAIYKTSFEPQSADAQFPYTLLTPALTKAKGKTSEKLIYDADDAIHILEWSGGQVIKKSYPYQTVNTVEMGSILLSSWLTISGITSSGAASVSTIDFNTATARHFAPFVNKLRPSLQSVDETQLRVEKEKLDYLSTLNFKLMNFGRSSLVRGETILQILLQPEIRKPMFALLGNIFQKTISPAHLVILTDHELILIQDVLHGRNARQPQYGGIWHYIPLRSIRSLTCSETENDWLKLSITVSSDKVIEKLFAVSSKPELEQLCAHFGK